MGNHEYCTDCGENDFHLGKPCNSERKAAHQAWKANIRAGAAARHAGERERLILAVQSVLLQHTLQNPLPYAVMAAMIADEILGTKPNPVQPQVETGEQRADHSRRAEMPHNTLRKIASRIESGWKMHMTATGIAFGILSDRELCREIAQASPEPRPAPPPLEGK